MHLRKTNLFYFALLLAALITLFAGLPYDGFKWQLKTAQGQSGDPITIEPVVTAFDWNLVFGKCAQLVPDLQELPIHVAMGLVVTEDPCAAAANLFDEMALMSPFNGLTGVGFDGFIEECSLEAAALDRFLDRLASYRPELAERARAAVNSANRCAFGRALAEGYLLPMDDEVVSRSTALMSVRRAFSVQDMHDIGATQCLGMNGGHNALVETVARRLDRITNPAELASTYNELCTTIKHVWFLGNLTGPSLEMYANLRQRCGFVLLDALELVAAGEYNGVLKQSLAQPDFCANAQQYLTETSLSIEEQINEDVPSALYTCPQLARVLQRNHELIPLSVHLRILQSDTPCEIAYHALWLVDQQGWFVSCMPDRSTLNLADGTTLTDLSSWQEKITALGQPYAAVEALCQQPGQSTVDLATTAETPNVDLAVAGDGVPQSSERAIVAYGYRPPASIREGMIHGVYVAGPIQSVPSDVNLVHDSDLTAEDVEWTLWGELTSEVTDDGISLTNTGEGGLYRDLGLALPMGNPLEMRVDLGNTSAARQEVELIVHDVYWEEALAGCYFVLPPNQPIETYTLRGLTLTDWTDVRIEIVPKTYDGQPALQVSDVYLQSGYSSSSNVACLGPLAAPDINLARNGDLAAGNVEWFAWGDVASQVTAGVLNLTNIGAGGIFQDIWHSLPEGASIEMTVDLGNASPASKEVELLVHNADWSDVLLCSFTLPPEQPLTTYTLRGQTQLAWSDIRLEIAPQTYDGQPALQVASINFQYHPGAFSDESVVCAESVLSATKPGALAAKTSAITQDDKSTRLSLSPTLPVSYTWENHYTPRFEATSTGAAQFESTDLFLLQDGKSLALTFYTVENERFPAFDPFASSVAYLAEFPDGQMTLNLINVDRRQPLTLLESTAERSIVPAPLAWSPDGIRVLVTLSGVEGKPGIYAIDLSSLPRIEEPELVIADGLAPAFAPNGRYIAFEREINGVRAIYVATTGTQIINAISDPAQGFSCFDPAFGQDSIALFFTCEIDGQLRLFQYKVGGVTEITLDAAIVANPAPGPGFGFMAFDDGEAIYFGHEDGTDVNIMLSQEGLQLYQFNWPAFRRTE